MTATATAAAPADSHPDSLPLFWWAPGTSLRERLDAPDLPAPVAPEPAGLPGLEQECLAVRLSALGVGAGLAGALAAEPADRLGGRVAKPDWAVFVERAVAAADSWEVVPVAGEGAEVFAPVLRPLVEAAVDALLRLSREAGAGPEDLSVLVPRFRDWLGRRISGLAARTLAVELAAARSAGLLGGSGPADRFADFLRRSGGRAGLGRLFAAHPVLARLLGRTCLRTALASSELVARLAADRRDITATILGGTAPGPLTEVELGLGDPHQGGRSVSLLRFADGSAVVYKPRPLDQHALLDRMAGWLDPRAPGLCLRTPRTVARDGYGWLEYITHRHCRSLAEVDLFYRRQGVLLALAHSVEGVDLHFDNLIAHGDQPVLVDVETLLHPALPETAAQPDPAAAALASSVHRTCLLPQLMVGEFGALDISAIGGAPGGTLPCARMGWDGAGTDTMRLVRRPAPFDGARNRPQPPGSGSGPTDHLEALLAGFRLGYDTVVAHRDDLTGPTGPLAGRTGAVGRLVARPTQLYCTLLEESTHPAVLRDGLDRDAMFSVLWAESGGDPARQRLIEHEIADLWDGDVPVFFHRPAGTDVWTSTGVRVSGVLDTSGLASALRKIGSMGAVDRHDQEWIISAALATAQPDARPAHRRPAGPARPSPAAVPEPQALLAAACGIADEIAGRAARGPGRVNWIGLEPVDTHWTMLPMGAGLAHGYCGAALFLAQVGQLTGSSRYRDLARAAVAPLPGLLATMADDPDLGRAVGPGGFDGLGGICYAVARLGTLLDQDLDGCLPTALQALAACLDDPGTTTDVSAGLSGALVALHAVHRESGLPEAARLADRLAPRLLARAGDAPAGHGFAFGSAGVGWALLRHARAAGPSAGERFAAAGRALVTGALAAAEQDPKDLGWCSGLSGTVLAAVDGLRWPAPDGAVDDALGRALRSLTGQLPSSDLSLCHGDLGVAEALGVLARRRPEARSALHTRAGVTLGVLRDRGRLCGTPGHVTTPGLLSGLSGIGYALLRLGFPDSVPSVLLLDPSPAWAS
ncbi:type 2 lanthipeptide synthetase LanM family protein [Kitasatospora sp. NPDC051853]|uniref:type 2 lanthipeptide synthetase LanM family protein n=1 Tax=Kitasatospora sp. NPDC051853 TaxID=3364058 RepID=UPI0037912C79